MKWKLVCAIALLGACNLSDPNSTPLEPRRQNNTNNNTTNTNNSVEVCDPACENGTCVNDACECEDGYTGESCDACAEGFQDHNENGVCSAACDATTCGDGGTCADDTGEIVCTCNEGYSGDLCDTCDDGFQDNNSDGTCEPTCLAAMLDCAPHGECSDADGTATCVCPVGTEGSGTRCDIAVPDAFTEWTPYGSAQLDDSTAVFKEPALCNENSGITGSYELADHSEIGPLLGTIEFEIRDGCDFIPLGCQPGVAPPAVRLNNSQFDYLPDSRTVGNVSHTFCLGEAYYGDVEIDLLPQHRLPEQCVEGVTGLANIFDLSFERLESDSFLCPDVGQVLNGDLQAPGDIPGWERIGNGVIALQRIGNDNSMIVEADGGCDFASASTKLSFPAAPEALAVRADLRSVTGNRPNIQLGDLTYLIPDGNHPEFKICVPPSAHGTVDTITFSTGNGSGSCAASDPRRLIIDDVEIIRDASCKVADGFVNGTFDDELHGWATDVDVVNGEGSTIVATAIGGDTGIVMKAPHKCSSPSIAQPVYFPRDGSVNMIEVSYVFENPDSDDTVAAVVDIQGSSGFRALGQLSPTTSTPATAKLCVDKSHWGYPGELRFMLSSGGACAVEQPIPLVILDAKLRQDAACD